MRKFSQSYLLQNICCNLSQQRCFRVVFTKNVMNLLFRSHHWQAGKDQNKNSQNISWFSSSLTSKNTRLRSNRVPTNNLLLSRKIWQKNCWVSGQCSVHASDRRCCSATVLLAPVQNLGELQHVSWATVQIQFFTINIHAKMKKNGVTQCKVYLRFQ